MTWSPRFRVSGMTISQVLICWATMIAFHEMIEYALENADREIKFLDERKYW